MAFTGKATYDGGAGLPEIAEDVSDIIGIVSPHETALLDHLGDPRRPARSTLHEWLEDALLPNVDQIDQASFTPSATAATSFNVDHGSRFRAGDQIRAEGSGEIMLVTGVSGATLTVVRGYGGTTAEALANNKVLTIIGNAALARRDGKNGARRRDAAGGGNSAAGGGLAAVAGVARRVAQSGDAAAT